MAAKQKKNKKDSQLLIRIDKETRDLFLELCDKQNTKAAREIRRFIQGYIDSHQGK
ncbi:hypothetical protein [Bowmanella dokdonensis]|uniref:Ribbon-helix-helix protein RHH domain-containing protein n=1 Tax=Bowmanella dokdonensis TaxID=751969 RepID=A0A939DR26_9ALTE|nr:hypothetical protein [Bowmanella dokdonensis]MBN7826660.1 hypothetical protein [Bowmanella dokdonensis]